jgi:hypothetical protein
LDRDWYSIHLEARPPAGAPLAEKLASKAGMPSWPFARAEAVRQDVLATEN